MNGAGAPDFFYREAQRLGYVARSAFKLLQMQKQYKLIKPGSSVLDLGCAPGAWLQVACQSLGPLKTGGVVVGIDLKKVKVPPRHCDARVKTVCADVMKLPKHQVRALSPQQKGFSVILSDMCPLVSGITTRDAALSVELGMQALDLAVGRATLYTLDDNVQKENEMDGSASDLENEGVLLTGGHLVIKLLESEDVKGWIVFYKWQYLLYLVLFQLTGLDIILAFFLAFAFTEISQICKPLFRKASWLRPKATRSSSREIYLICQGLQQGQR